jgi:hypothetical protein
MSKPKLNLKNANDENKTGKKLFSYFDTGVRLGKGKYGPIDLIIVNKEF